MGEKINEKLKQHVDYIDDWKYKDLAAQLHHWVNLFNLEFKLEIETPAVRVDERARGRSAPTEEGGTASD